MLPTDFKNSKARLGDGSVHTVLTTQTWGLFRSQSPRKSGMWQHAYRPSTGFTAFEISWHFFGGIPWGLLASQYTKPTSSRFSDTGSVSGRRWSVTGTELQLPCKHDTCPLHTCTLVSLCKHAPLNMFTLISLCLATNSTLTSSWDLRLPGLSLLGRSPDV